MIYFALVLSAVGYGFSQPTYKCGSSVVLSRPYGKVEQRVDCADWERFGYMTVTEYKGDAVHGISMSLDRRGRKLDSTFFLDNKKSGFSFCWDTLGNVLCKHQYRDGKQIGLREEYYSPGKPAMRKTYNDSGVQHGFEKVWWRNGNLKHEYTIDRGTAVQAKEYFPTGKPRSRHRRPYQESGTVGAFKRKLIDAETWAPNGKSTGTVKNGNGRLLRFSAEPDSLTGRYTVWDETYKDSLLSKGGKLDSARVAELLK